MEPGDDASVTGALPARRADLEVAEFDTEYVVYDPRGQRVHRLSGLAAVVFDACDGVTSHSHLIGEVQTVLDVSSDEAAHVVEDALTRLGQAGLLAVADPAWVGGDSTSAARPSPPRWRQRIRRRSPAQPG